MYTTGNGGQSDGLRITAARILTKIGILGIFCLFLGITGCTAQAVKPGQTISEFTGYLDQEVPQLLKRYGVPGASIALVHNGAPIWTAAYGYADLESGREMTVDTTCRAESISKSVTAWGVMNLVEQGIISLDDPLSEHLPEWEWPESEYDGTEVTLRHLLSGTSGLPLGTIGKATEYEPGSETPSTEDFVRSDTRLVAEPGAGFIYSDVGFNLLEIVVEKVSGQDYADYMAQEVLSPLGMNDSSFAWQESYAESLATGYEMDGTAVGPYIYPASASGGLFTDVEDIARFVASGMTWEADAGQPVLPSELLEAVYEAQAEIPGLFSFVADHYGFGHFIETLPDGRKAVWHGGQGHGWMSHFHSVPESGEGLVVLTNSQRSWPFLAVLLPEWAAWNGAGSVKFGIIRSVITAAWILFGLISAAVLSQVYRLITGLRRGKRRTAGLSAGSIPLRLLQMVVGLAVIAVVVWRLSLPYVFEASILPTAAPWLAAALFAAALVLLLSALMPRSARRQGED